jgi:hypothetical protein
MKSTNKYASANYAADTLFADLPDNQHDLERLQPETAVLDLPEVKDIPGQEHIRVMPLGELADTTISSADEEGAGILDFDTATDDELDGNVIIDTDEEEEFDAEDDDNVDGLEEDELEDADILTDEEMDDDAEEDDLVEDEDEDFDDEDIEPEEDDITASGSGNDVVAGTSLAGSFDESAKQYREAKEAEVTEDELRLIENTEPDEKDSDTDSLNRSRLDNTDFEGEALNEAASLKDQSGSDLDVPGAELDDADEALGEEDEENNIYSTADTE